MKLDPKFFSRDIKQGDMDMLAFSISMSDLIFFAKAELSDEILEDCVKRLNYLFSKTTIEERIRKNQAMVSQYLKERSVYGR